MAENLRKPDGGTAAVKDTDITFGGVPFKTERDFPYGYIVGVDDSVMERYVNVRGEWEDEDGNILFRSQNTHDFTGLGFEIELHHGLAAVHELVGCPDTVGIERREHPHGLAAGRLDLHDIRAEVAEVQGRLRPWDELADVNDANATKEIGEGHIG